MRMSSKTVYKKGKFTVIQTSTDYVVRNERLDYAHHSHFHSLKGAKRSIDLISRRVLPQNEWWREALRRLLTEEEYLSLQPNKKQAYYNVQGGKGVKYGRV